MGFSSMDDLVNEITSGKYIRTDWNKITTAGITYAAGRWYDFSLLAGTPIANAWAGTALAWRTCDETTGNGTQVFGMWTGGNVSPDTKHILNVSAVTAVATGVPAQLMLVDLQGYWPGISNNSAVAQTLTGTPSLRYTNGEGCRLFWVQTATAGATAQNLSLSYSNTVPTSGRSLACDGFDDSLGSGGSHLAFWYGGEQLRPLLAVGFGRYRRIHGGIRDVLGG